MSDFLYRKWMDGPAVQAVECKYGTVMVVPTSNDHVFVSTSYGNRHCDISIRKVIYNVTVHLYRTPDGWRPRSRFNHLPADQYPDVYAHRRGGSVGDDMMSPQNVQTLLAALLPAINAHLAGQSVALAEAYVATVNNDLLRVEAEILKAEKQLAELNAKRRDLLVNLVDANNQLRFSEAAISA